MKKYLVLLVLITTTAEADEISPQQKQAYSVCAIMTLYAAPMSEFAIREIFNAAGLRFGKLANDIDEYTLWDQKFNYERERGRLSDEEIMRQAEFCLKYLD